MTTDTPGASASSSPTASLAQALGVVTDHLEAVYADVAVLEEWLRAATAHDAEAAYRLVAHLDALTAALADVSARAESLETQLESIERRTAEEVSRLRADVKRRLCALEQGVSEPAHDRQALPTAVSLPRDATPRPRQTTFLARLRHYLLRSPPGACAARCPKGRRANVYSGRANAR